MASRGASSLSGSALGIATEAPMTVPSLVVSLPWILLLAYGAGTWAVPSRKAGQSRLGHAGITITAGLLLLAAIGSALGSFQVSRVLVVSVAIATSVGGLARTGFRVRSRGRIAAPKVRFEALGGFTLLLLLASSAAHAFTKIPWSHDALAIWWPKVRAISMTQPAMLVAADPLVIPEGLAYPFGMAWLVHFAAGFGEPDLAMACWVPWLFFPLIALSLVGLAELFQARALGIVAALLWISIPEVLINAPSGLSDFGIAGCVLLAGTSLGLARSVQPYGLLALASAAAAPALKDEGLVVLASTVVAVLLTWRRLRDRGRLLAGSVLLLFPLPWLFVRAGVESWQLRGLDSILEAKELLLARLLVLPSELWRMVTDRGSLEVQASGSWRWSVVGPLVFGLLLLHAPRGRRPISILPALGILGALVLTLLVGTVAPSHQLAFSGERLLIQTLPLLLLSVLLRYRREEGELGFLRESSVSE